MKEGLMNILPGGGGVGGNDDVARSHSETTSALGHLPSQPSSSRNRKRSLEISTTHPTMVVGRKNTMTSTSSSHQSSSSHSRNSFSTTTSCSPLASANGDEPVCESVNGLLKMQRSTSILSLTSIGSSSNNLHALDLASSVDYTGGIGALLSIGLNNPGTRGNSNSGMLSVFTSCPLQQSTTQGCSRSSMDTSDQGLRTAMDTSTHSLLSFETRCQAPSHLAQDHPSHCVSMSSASSTSSSSHDSKSEGMRESSSVSMDGISSIHSSSNLLAAVDNTIETGTRTWTGTATSSNLTPLALRRLEIAQAQAITTNRNQE